MKTELNLIRNIYGKESAAPRGACLAGILRSRGCAPRCGASPRAIAPAAPPAPRINAQTPTAPDANAQTPTAPDANAQTPAVLDANAQTPAAPDTNAETH